MVKPCKPDEIRNPKTGRCVKRNGKIGKEILGERKQKSQQKDSKTKECPSGTIFNPKSGRCVKINGKIGRELVRLQKPKSPSPKSLKSPSSSPIEKEIIDKFGNNIYKELDKDYKITKIVGSGAFGTVYLECKKRSIQDCDRVVKLEDFKRKKRSSIEKEIEMQRKFSDIGLSPKVFKSKIVNNTSMIEMERLECSVEKDFLTKKWPEKIIKDFVKFVESTLNKMCEYNLSHGDLHFGNMGYNMVKGKIKLYLLDFGFSMKDKCIPEIELAKLIGTYTPKYYKNLNKETYDLLFKELITLDKKMSSNPEYGNFKLDMKMNPYPLKSSEYYKLKYDVYFHKHLRHKVLL